MKTYRIKQVIQYGDRDYAVLSFMDEDSGGSFPFLNYKEDKNHEEHAVNSFIKHCRLHGHNVFDEREKPLLVEAPERKVRVTIETENGRFSTEVGI